MSRLLAFLKTTLLGGALVLLPVVLAAFAVVSAVTAVHAFTVEVGRALHLPGTGVPFLNEAFAVALVVLLCFLFGLLVRTRLGRSTGKVLETALLDRLPGYRMFRRVAAQVGGSSSEAFGTPVWVTLQGARQIGFLTDRHPGGDVTVFVPTSPVLTVGNVYVVPGDRTERIDRPLPAIAKVLGEMGAGSSAL